METMILAGIRNLSRELWVSPFPALTWLQMHIVLWVLISTISPSYHWVFNHMFFLLILSEGVPHTPKESKSALLVTSRYLSPQHVTCWIAGFYQAADKCLFSISGARHCARLWGAVVEKQTRTLHCGAQLLVGKTNRALITWQAWQVLWCHLVLWEALWEARAGPIPQGIFPKEVIFPTVSHSGESSSILLLFLSDSEG